MLWGLTGCHVVFGTDPVVSETVCGVFGPATPLAFSPALTAVTELSVSRDGTRGFVRAEHAGRTRLVPIRSEDGAWVHDEAYETNLEHLHLNELVDYGHITARDQLIAAQRSRFTGDYTPYEYRFDGAQWVLANNSPVSFATDHSTFAGGDVALLVGGGADLVEQVPIIHSRSDLSSSVAIAIRRPTEPTFQEAVSGGQLTTFAINDVHRVTGAALAVGPSGALVLVYAATPLDATTGADLYMSEKKGDTFPVGTPLEVLNTEEEDEVEPWVSEDCRTLYFRRGDAVVAAVAQ